MTTRIAMAGMVTCLLLAGGCGYRAGGPFRSDVQSVHVEMFGSREFRRDLEFKLTEAVKKRISMDTPYRLAGPHDADTILVAEVLEEQRRAFAPDPESYQPRDVQLTLAVRVLWKDARSGRILAERQIQLQSTDYLPAAGEPEALGQERAIDRQAGRIVAMMYEAW